MGQLSLFEFAIFIALGSAVGDPMFYGDVPLLHTMLVIAIIVALQRLLSVLTSTNENVERFIDGQTRMVVDCGRIKIEERNQDKKGFRKKNCSRCCDAKEFLIWAKSNMRSLSLRGKSA